MRIICVYKTGGDYDHRYVVALRDGVRRYLGCEHTFLCLTDSPDLAGKVQQDVQIEPLQYSWPGWWSKLELFRPDLMYSQTTIYFDLDVLIKRNIEDFVKVCRKNTRPVMLRSAHPIGKDNDWPSSSIMSWKGRAMNRVWFAWIKDPNENIKQTQLQTTNAGQKTDQGFIRHHVNPTFFQDQLTKEYVAFKVDYFNDPSVYDRVRILNWTGKPRFHTMQYQQDYWEIHSLWNTRHENVKLTNQVVA